MDRLSHAGGCEAALGLAVSNRLHCAVDRKPADHRSGLRRDRRHLHEDACLGRLVAHPGCVSLRRLRHLLRPRRLPRRIGRADRSEGARRIIRPAPHATRQRARQSDRIGVLLSSNRRGDPGGRGVRDRRHRGGRHLDMGQAADGAGDARVRGGDRHGDVGDDGIGGVLGRSHRGDRQHLHLRRQPRDELPTAHLRAMAPCPSC